MADMIEIPKDKIKPLLSILKDSSVRVDDYVVNTRVKKDEEDAIEIDLALTLQIADYKVFEKASNYAMTESTKKACKVENENIVVPFTTKKKEERGQNKALFVIADRFIDYDKVWFEPKSRKSKGFYVATLELTGDLKPGGVTKLSDTIDEEIGDPFDFNFDANFDKLFSDLFSDTFKNELHAEKKKEHFGDDVEVTEDIQNYPSGATVKTTTIKKKDEK